MKDKTWYEPAKYKISWLPFVKSEEFSHMHSQVGENAN